MNAIGQVDSVDLICTLNQSLNGLVNLLRVEDSVGCDQDQNHSQIQFYDLLIYCLELKLKIFNCRREEEILKTCEILEERLEDLEGRNLQKLMEIKKYRILGQKYDQVAKEYLRLSRERERLKMDLARLES